MARTSMYSSTMQDWRWAATILDEASLDDWETMIDTNLKGLMFVSKAVLPFMINNKKRTYHQYQVHGRQRSI